jgi:hypothetical protein
MAPRWAIWTLDLVISRARKDQLRCDQAGSSEISTSGNLPGARARGGVFGPKNLLSIQVCN